MLRNAFSPKMSPGMLRSVPRPVSRSLSIMTVALVGTLWAHSARAQEAADLVTRIDRLEAAIRELTGHVEQLQYRNRELEQQLRRMQEATAGAVPPQQPQPGSYPPPSASRPASGIPGPVASAIPPEQVLPAAPGRRGDVFDPAANPTAPGSPRSLGASTAANEPPPVYERSAGGPDAPGAPGPRGVGAPLDLSSAPEGGVPPGALPPPPPRTLSSTGAMQATLPPGNTPKDEYDLAYGYVLHRDFGLAAETFRTFLRQYPSDRMAPEAQYWLGESMFQQQQYREAAESFLAVSTKYDTTARAPEALLRLGQSLAALGEKEAACASLGEVLRKYPRAAANVKQSVEREQKRVRC
jgi:tol-pal system protein YbgF